MFAARLRLRYSSLSLRAPGSFCSRYRDGENVAGEKLPSLAHVSVGLRFCVGSAVVVPLINRRKTRFCRCSNEAVLIVSQFVLADLEDGPRSTLFPQLLFCCYVLEASGRIFAESENPDIFMGERARSRSTVIVSRGFDEALFYRLTCGKPFVSLARPLRFSDGIVNIGHYPAVPPPRGTEEARLDAGALS